MLRTLSIGLAALLLAGCEGVGLVGVDQGQLCLFSSDDDATKCKEGELAYFKPAQAAGGQTVLNVAAAYCNIGHEIVTNEGGVLCVFTRKRMHLMK
ncbi:hypothetical protein RM531_05330 [Salinisphaera sp. P385]|uniref:Lipoprotein n=1 Tax=Spectribacter acetivorans TaxID=3075603 RepID=A0ABU3B766_9GAMM|nr:hypothetical protein [Salinisphaera sp. P385]MDT0617885.1 hypothetical protein [Salinisphaera sp. P385]